MDSDLTMELTQRLNGPFSLRMLLQPCMALLFAMRDGKADGLKGAQPYLQRILLRADQRRETIGSAWASIGKVFVVATVLDAAFQFATHGAVSLAQAVAVAVLLCVLPYSLMRGPTARLYKK